MSIIHATDASFKRDVLESDLPVLVDFWAPWCGPCKMLSPVLEELYPEIKSKFRVVKVDVDENSATASSYNIRTIPTLMIFHKGHAVDTKMGLLPKAKLKEWIEGAV